MRRRDTFPRRSGRSWAWAWGLALTLGPQSAAAWSGELITTTRVFRQSLPEDLQYAQLRLPALTTTVAAGRSELQLHLLGELRHRPVDALGLRIGLDTGILAIDLEDGRVFGDGRDLGDRAKETGFLGETSVDLQLGASGVVELRLGKLRPRIGSGAIFDAYALGFSADADLRLLDQALPLTGRLDLVLPDATFTSAGKNSPLLALQLGLHLGQGWTLRAIGAAYLDGGEGLAPLLADAYGRGRIAAAQQSLDQLVDRFPPRLQAAAKAQADAALLRAGELYNQGVIGYDVTTSGYLAYGGLEGRYRGERLRLEALFLWAHGVVDTTIRPNEGYAAFLNAAAARFPNLAQSILDRQNDAGPVTIDGQFARLTGSLELPGALQLRGFGLYLSGDQGLRTDDSSDRRYDAFVALAPLVTHTSIFFNGGLASSQASPTVVSPAPDGAGILGGGVGAEARPTEWLSAWLLGASLWSPAGNGAGAHHYGLELDLGAEALVDEHWALSLEGAVFQAGDYFGDRPWGYQLILGAQLYLGAP